MSVGHLFELHFFLIRFYFLTFYTSLKLTCDFDETRSDDSDDKDDGLSPPDKPEKQN